MLVTCQPLILLILIKILQDIFCIVGARPLYEKEKVTAHMILNWFANSRKEVKKLAKEGQLNGF